MCVLGNQLSESYLISSYISKTPLWEGGPNSLLPCQNKIWTPEPIFCPRCVPRLSLAGGGGSRWQYSGWEMAGAPWNGVWKPHFWKLLPASCSAKTWDFSVLSRSGTGSSPKVINGDARYCQPWSSSWGLCACEMNFLLIIKCSPTYGKLPFLGPLKSDLMQSPFPHGTEERRSVWSHSSAH